jgi:ubiquinone/menaquinone biosynthesis C-methylase UbiE
MEACFMALTCDLVKKAVKRVAPALEPSLVKSWHRFKIERAAWALRTATPTNRHLSSKQLRSMNAAYAPMPEYGYDAASLEARGTERATALKKKFLLTEGQILEVGCWDGMVLAALQSDRIKCTGIDFRDEGFDPRARQKGVRLIKMDATTIGFEDDTFNFVFSHATFEHLRDPAAVFSEIVRVTKPGGYIFLEFAPLYMSPWGLHAYRSVRVPYCQFLFSQEDMSVLVKEEGLEPINEYCNGWRPTQFQEIFTDRRVDCLSYEEGRDISAIDLIIQYAPIFRNYTNNVEELIINGISALFRRKC